ncbi:hypothetical protein ACJX0J_036076, partial [Zea mays]
MTMKLADGRILCIFGTIGDPLNLCNHWETTATGSGWKSYVSPHFYVLSVYYYAF